MRSGYVRPIALCVFRHSDRILVAEGYDPIKQQAFYRPLGGTIEFGELSINTVIREIDEELRVAVTNVRYLGTLENIFDYAGQMGHEIVLVYDGEFADRTLYDRQVIYGAEIDGATFRAVWLALADCRTPAAQPLYPTGLLELLEDVV